MLELLNFFLSEYYPFIICLLGVLVAVQILFCYKVKHRWVSMLPSLLLVLLLAAVLIPYLNMLYGGVSAWFWPTVLLAVAVIFPGQLILCFQARRLVFRLLPTAVLFLSCIAGMILGLSISGWDGVVFIFIALYVGFCLIMDGLAWGIWAMIRYNRKSGPKAAL